MSRRGLHALVALAAVVTAPPAAFGALCSRGSAPAATLLVPYFEVDLGSAGGRTTLLSIGSTADEPTLVKVTLWSDWSIPVYGFYVGLGPQAVETINLRDVVGAVQVPPLVVDPERFPGCHAPAPPIGPIGADELQRRLTGQPDALGNCTSRSRRDVELAVGFVTADVVRDCDLALPTPLDASYADLALDDNVLWGDVIYVAATDASAQGQAAVAIRADASSLDRTFYPNPALHRVHTDEVWRARFLGGGPLDTSSELVAWIGHWSGYQRALCGSTDPVLGLAYMLRSGPEAGPLEPRLGPFGFEAAAVTRKLTVGELLGEAPAEAGSLELEAWQLCFLCPVVEPFRLPSVVWTIHRAAGRFSVGLEATPVGGSCAAE